jgi:hypothetical protein
MRRICFLQLVVYFDYPIELLKISKEILCSHPGTALELNMGANYRRVTPLFTLEQGAVQIFICNALSQ